MAKMAQYEQDVKAGIELPPSAYAAYEARRNPVVIPDVDVDANTGAADRIMDAVVFGPQDKEDGMAQFLLETQGITPGGAPALICEDCAAFFDLETGFTPQSKPGVTSYLCQNCYSKRFTLSL